MSEGDDEVDRQERILMERQGFVAYHPDSDDIARVPVEDWRDVILRITGPDSRIPDMDGLDVELGQFAGENSVVELIVEGEVVARLVKMDDSD